MLYYCALGIGAVVTLVFCFVRTRGNSVGITIFKAVSSCCYLLTAVMATMANESMLQYGLFIIMGGMMGLVGDIMLDLKGVYSQDKVTYLMCGYIFFLIGHVFYLIAMFIRNEYKASGIIIAAVISVAFSAAAVFSGKITGLRFGKFRWVSFIYGIFLAAVSCFTIVPAIRTGNHGMIVAAVGAVSFLVSDIILSYTYFGGKDGKAWLFWNHFFYYAGQYLLAASIFIS